MNNFFDLFWRPYLEYETKFGFGLSQQVEEVKDLNINPGDVVANIGINWGHSVQLILEYQPCVRHVAAIDSSKVMLDLARRVFSAEYAALSGHLQQISPSARLYLSQLHEKAKTHRSKVDFIYCSAEETDMHVSGVDGILATMGLHWLKDPKEESFASMGRALKKGGILVFSTASAFFDTESSQNSFTLNPYYMTFFDILRSLYDSGHEVGVDYGFPRNKFTLDDVTSTVESAGFVIESYREHKIHIGESMIDDVCIAGVKFKYPFDGEEVKIQDAVADSFRRTKEKVRYEQSPAQYEICPIFRIRKLSS